MNREKIEEGIRLFLEGLGEDPDRKELRETPARVAEAARELFAGLRVDPAAQLKPSFGTASGGQEDYILVQDIAFHSFCEHHLLPFFGHVHIAYVPKEGWVTGFSEMGRVVHALSRRLQLQERLTESLASLVSERLGARGALVVVEAQQLCMIMRGERMLGSSTLTVASRGVFSERPHLRQEVLDRIQKGKRV